MRRVKYYSKYDLSIGYYLENVSDLIVNSRIETDNHINKILELYNCVQYINNGIFSINWSEEHINKLKEKSKEIFSSIARYFNEIDNSNFYSIIEKIDFMYKEDFLELFSKFKLMEKVDEMTFRKALELKYFQIHEVCLHEKIIKSYPNSIRAILIRDPRSIELILDNFVVSKKNYKKLYFPNNLSMEDIHVLIYSYIECNKSNSNYLELIVKNRNTDEFSVTEDHRWRAKVKLKKIYESIFQDNNGLVFSYAVKLDSNVEDIVSFEINGENYTIILNKEYLEDTLDYPSILNNFIYVFEFVDLNGLVTFVSDENKGNLSLLEFLSLKSKNDYPSNIHFQSLERFYHLLIHMYYNFLKSHNIYLEEVIQWFFQQYLKEEFNISNFIFSIPSKLSTYREKCRDILAEFEYMLQQYKCYIEYGFINHEMLELSSNGIKFNQLPSVMRNKYVYPKESLDNIFYLLFSNQSGLGYLGENKKSKDTFYELMNKEAVNYNEFENYQQTSLDYLCENKYIVIDRNGKLEWYNPNRIIILKKLYDHGVIVYNRLSSNLKKELMEMKTNDFIEFESTLLTRQEQDLLDYYLNNSKFQNGPQIRNKYSHGREGNRDENINYNNYLTIIRLVIAVIIKINDDLCLNARNNHIN